MTTSIRASVATVAIGLIAGMAAIANVSPAAAAVELHVTKTATSYLTPSDPMPGERVTWTGTTAVIKKKVDVQVAKGRKWQTLTTVRTDASGVFVVPVSGGKPGTVVKYRVVRAGETLARRKVITVAQTATLSAPTAPYGNQVRMTATFTPARPGRRVGLLGNGGWMQDPKSQNATGQVTFKVTLSPGPLPGAPVRADAYPYNGAPDIFTNTQYVPPNIVTP